MKAIKKTKTIQSNNITPAIPAAIARLDFAKSIKLKNHENNHVEKFLQILDGLMNMKQSFTQSEVFYYAQPYELPATDVKYLLQRWCDYMQRINKIAIIEGCFDESLICLV